jgi:hypothetical protein
MCRGAALPYDTLFLGREKNGMKSNLLAQRNKYQREQRNHGLKYESDCVSIGIGIEI